SGKRRGPSYSLSTGKVWSSKRKGFLMACAALLLLGQRRVPVAPASWQRRGQDSVPAPDLRSVSAQDHESPSTTDRGAAPAARQYEFQSRGRCETAAGSPSGDDIL